MSYKKAVCYYRSGPIERDPGAAFHAKNRMDNVFTEEFGFKIVGDTFEHLTANNCPQAVYGAKMKKLRDRGKFAEYCRSELLLTMSLREVRRRSAFTVVRPAPEASGGTTSETVMMWLKGIPKLVIIGPHGEGLLDNNSTFVIRMLIDRYALVFNTEKEVIEFVREHVEIFRHGREAIRQMIMAIKGVNPYVNDRPKPLYDERLEGKTVLIQGRPGAGKDTQARMLQDLCGFKFFGSGFALRRLSAKFHTLGESLSKGNLAPEIIINYLIAQSLLQLEKFESIVFSGAAKKPGEAKGLFELLGLLGRKLVVIVIDINEDLVRERIILRRNCDSCEMSFCGKEFVERPICPNCNIALSARAENMNEESIKKILAWYKTDVETVIKFFEDMGLVVHVDGHRTKEEIFDDILSILRK